MNFLVKTAFVSLIAAISTFAIAEDTVAKNSIGAFGSYTDSDGTESGTVFFSFASFLTPQISIDANAGVIFGDSESTSVGADGTYYLTPVGEMGSFVPKFFGGVSTQIPAEGDSLNFLNVGVGAEYFLKENASFDIKLSARESIDSDIDASATMLQFGLKYYF